MQLQWCHATNDYACGGMARLAHAELMSTVMRCGGCYSLWMRTHHTCDTPVAPIMALGVVLMQAGCSRRAGAFVSVSRRVTHSSGGRPCRRYRIARVAFQHAHTSHTTAPCPACVRRADGTTPWRVVCAPIARRPPDDASSSSPRHYITLHCIALHCITLHYASSSSLQRAPLAARSRASHAPRRASSSSPPSRYIVVLPCPPPSCVVRRVCVYVLRSNGQSERIAEGRWARRS